MKTEIGIFEVSYNQNSRVAYSKFTSLIEVRDKQGCIVEDCTPDKIEQKVQEAVSQWFSKVEDVELSDKFEKPIKLETIETKYFASGKVKLIKIKVYQD